MPKLIVDLNRFRNVLYGSIRHMDESLRRKGILASTEGYRIESVNMPQMKANVLCVRGGRTHLDDHAFCLTYKNEESAERAEQAYLELIEEINNA